MPTSEADTIWAAGGVVWRDTGGTVELLLVHRPRYDDWTLPKGKLRRDEAAGRGALREVEEETGLRCRLGPELTTTFYVDRKGRRRHVRYWAMTPERGAFAPNDEVDKVRWLSVPAATALVSYERETTVIGDLLDVLLTERASRR